MKHRRLFTVGLGFALVAPLAAPSAASTPSRAPADVPRAVDYLKAQQEPDGGFELADFAGFETSDVILALAANSQTGSTWSTAQAMAAVLAAKSSANKTPLDAIDDLVDGAAAPDSVAAGAQAAKVLALVANPLGISATDFDPSADSVAPVDLLARMNLHRAGDGSYAFAAQFNGALYAALALDGLGQPVPAGLVTQIKTAQRSDGSWNFAGDQKEDSPGEVDTTSLALLALSAANLDLADATVRKGANLLAKSQSGSGAWKAFGTDDPNSTAVAAVALSALHLDVTDTTWVNKTYGPGSVGSRVGFDQPYAWLATQQDTASGRIKSPNDSYGINTLATSQTVQALARQWYLRDDHAALLGALTTTLANATATADGVRALGPNVSIRTAREAAADAVVMSQAGRERAVADVFQQVFARSLDSSGRAFWSNRLLVISRAELLSQLTGSSEFYRLAGGTTPKFVDAAYQAVLSRAPEAGGRAYWIARLDAGASVESIARSLVLSQEYRGGQVDAAYANMLARRPDAGGRAYWTARLATTRVEVILSGLGGSAEFFERATR
ncbi:MAG: DUF4214 domain-containing protein [Aquihabitans sp.]